MTSSRASRWHRLALLADVIALLGAGGCALVAGPALALPGFSQSGVSPRALWLISICLAFVMIASVARRRHAGHLPVSLLRYCSDALRASSTGALLAIATASILGADGMAASLVLVWLFTVLLMSFARVTIGLLTRGARLRGELAVPTLVVGAGLVGGQVARRLAERSEFGLRPVGFLDADPMPGEVDAGGVPVLGGPDDLDAVCAATGARHVILAFASERDHRLVEMVRRCQTLRVEVSVVPRLYESINERVKLSHLGGLPLLWLRPINPKGWQFAVKYMIDRVVATLALVALAPLLGAIAIAVALSSPGPVIFRQRRVGRDGRTFDLLKFRSMTRAEDDRPFAPGAGSAPGGVEGTDRRTRIGCWLRSTSLDELPQLLNVLRGDMSLIGPRPERPQYVEQFAGEIPRYHDRHRVKSGITGWAQVNGLRGQTSIADRIEWDNYYIENWSLALDIRTLALTIAEVLRFREDRRPEPAMAADSAIALVPDHIAAPAGAGAQAVPAPQSAASWPAPPSQPPAPTLLRLVPATAGESIAEVWFCGRCGASPSASGTPTPYARVCTACGDGLLLEARSDVAPHDDEAFMIVDSRLTVQALSNRAEKALGLSEEDATDCPIAELLVAADAESETQESLPAMLVRAAAGGEYAERTFVRPRDTFGVRIPVRISSCGPPRAALIVFESGPAAPPQLRLAPESLPAAEQSSAG